MPSFYNANLSSSNFNYSSFQSQDYPKQYGKFNKGDAENGIYKTKNVIQSVKNKIGNPHENVVQYLKNVISIAVMSLMAFFIYYIIGPLNDDFAVEDFVVPCNSTNITVPFDELKSMKNKLDEISYAKNSIKFVAEYNISNYTNEYLVEKYANLSSVGDEIDQTFGTQRELYFNCYKENLLEECKNERASMMRNRAYFDAIFSLIITVLIHTIEYFYNKKNVESSFDQIEADIDKLSTTHKELKNMLKNSYISMEECERLEADIALKVHQFKLQQLKEKFVHIGNRFSLSQDVVIALRFVFLINSLCSISIVAIFVWHKTYIFEEYIKKFSL